MSEKFIVRLDLCKIQIQIHQRCHQKSFARAHRQTEKIIGVINAVKDFLCNIFKIYASGIFGNNSFIAGKIRRSVSALLPDKLENGFSRNGLFNDVSRIDGNVKF